MSLEAHLEIAFESFHARVDCVVHELGEFIQRLHELLHIYRESFKLFGEVFKIEVLLDCRTGDMWVDLALGIAHTTLAPIGNGLRGGRRWFPVLDLAGEEVGRVLVEEDEDLGEALAQVECGGEDGDGGSELARSVGEVAQLRETGYYACGRAGCGAHLFIQCIDAPAGREMKGGRGGRAGRTFRTRGTPRRRGPGGARRRWLGGCEPRCAQALTPHSRTS